jgi:hypothetical protein
MAIRDNIYQDLIMNPEFMPNRLQNLEMFPPVDNVPSRLDTSFSEIPGFNFIDAPIETPFIQRAFKPEFRPFLNNPRTGIVDNFLMQKGNPENTIFDRAKSGIGKGIDLGKSAIGGIASLITGIPGIGALLGAFQETPEQRAIKEFYESQFGLTDTGQIASGIMQGYNPVYGFGGAGLNQAIDKRIARIQKTLQKKKSDTLKKRLKDLQDLKRKEAAASAAALEAQRRGRRPSAPSGDGVGIKDSGGPTGGFSYDTGGREGFGYGLKKGGLAGLL